MAERSSKRPWKTAPCVPSPLGPRAPILDVQGGHQKEGVTRDEVVARRRGSRRDLFVGPASQGLPPQAPPEGFPERLLLLMQVASQTQGPGPGHWINRIRVRTALEGLLRMGQREWSGKAKGQAKIQCKCQRRWRAKGPGRTPNNEPGSLNPTSYYSNPEPPSPKVGQHYLSRKPTISTFSLACTLTGSHLYDCDKLASPIFVEVWMFMNMLQETNHYDMFNKTGRS